MDNNEKFAMRYGAEGRNINDVIRSSPEKITSPNKIFDAWDKGTNMRKDGTSKDFLERIEKKEMDDLLASINEKKDPNGISAEPIKDIWVNDLFSSAYENAEKTKDSVSIEKLPFIADPDNPIKAQTLPRINNLLPNSKDYDIMYLGEMTNYSSPASSGQATQNASEAAKSDKTHVTYGHSDKNVVGGIQLRLNELGYTGIDITGTFDEKTEAGIKEFQEDRGLPVTGVLDDVTKKEMGFSDDYSVSRKGANATPWMPPDSQPFNMDAYKRRQERLKQEKEDAKKAEKEKEEKESSILSLLANVVAGLLYNHGGAQPFSQESDIIYDEYQKNIENDLNEFSKKYGPRLTQDYMEGLNP